MSYQIKWETHGAIKYFTGTVSSRDLVESEKEVISHPHFTEFRYVISVYLTAEGFSFTEVDRQQVRALRLGVRFANPHLKYALVSQDPAIVRNIQDGIDSGEPHQATAVFPDFIEAVIWTNTRSKPTHSDQADSSAGKGVFPPNDQSV